MHSVGASRPKLLLAEDDAASARLLTRVLVQAGYDVEPVLTGRAALERLSSSRFHVIVCDWTLPDIDGIAVVRHVRSRPAEQPLVVLVASFNSQGAREHALRAGADDYIAKPFEPLQLLELISAGLARRAEANAPCTSSSVTDFPPPPPSTAQKPLVESTASLIPPNRAVAIVENTAAWRGLPQSVAATLSEGIGVDLTYERATVAESGESMSASGFMVNVSHLIQVAAALFVSWNSGAELARVILRDASPDDVVIRELLIELGNSVLGNVKTALRRDGLLFTLGLGQAANMPMASSFARSFSATWVGGFCGPSLRIVSVFGLRSIGKVTMPLRKLKENMVLAEDLVSENGTLILAAGSRLTSSTTERLARQFAHRSVQVCIPPQGW